MSPNQRRIRELSYSRFYRSTESCLVVSTWEEWTFTELETGPATGAATAGCWPSKPRSMPKKETGNLSDMTGGSMPTEKIGILFEFSSLQRDDVRKLRPVPGFRCPFW